jgi:hypothetical protein
MHFNVIRAVILSSSRQGAMNKVWSSTALVSYLHAYVYLHEYLEIHCLSRERILMLNHKEKGCFFTYKPKGYLILAWYKQEKHFQPLPPELIHLKQ